MLWVSYILLINVITFLVFGEDKKRARQKKRRIPERTLLLLALFGGAVGAWIGMYVFHHKTRKLNFRAGIPMMLILHLVLIYSVCRQFIQ